MDRFPDLALLAMDATAQASRPRRRWSDGPRYAWAEESGAAEWSLEPMWPKISACASECMAQVAAALGREIARLQLDGRVHPADAKSLSSLAESLARSSRGVQQVVRLGGGRVQLAAERVDLVALVRDTVHDMQADLRSRGAEVTFDMRPSEVLIDPSLALGIVSEGLQWALGFSSRVKVKLERQPSGRAQLVVRGELSHAQGNGAGDAAGRNRRMNGNLHWVLLRQLAAHAQVQLSRSSSASSESAVLEFERTYQHPVEGISTVELFGENAFCAAGAAPWVLVAIHDVELREQVLGLLQRSGFDADAAVGCDQVREVCGARMPKVLVGCEQGHGLEQLRREWAAQGHRCGHIHVMRETPSFHLHGFSASDLVRIGRNNLERELVPAVIFEIAHQE